MSPIVARNTNRASLVTIALALTCIDYVFLRSARTTAILVCMAALAVGHVVLLVLFTRWLRHQRGI